MGRPRSAEPSERERHYRRLLAELAETGGTLRAFARSRGIAETTLAWWRHTIAKRDREHSLHNDDAANGVSLVPVEVVGPRPSSGFVVELRSGRRLEVAPGFDARELQRLVEALDAC